jgi:hypothetical protein
MLTKGQNLARVREFLDTLSHDDLAEALDGAREVVDEVFALLETGMTLGWRHYS